jgi:DNA-binding transcriptional LysR family regulator
MINSSDLRSFTVTARALHLTRAAKELGLSQPALSHCIKRLEADIGEELFLRRKEGLILTKAGEFLLLKGQKIIDELEQVAETLKTGQTTSKASLTVGIHPSVAAYTMPAILKQNTGIDFHFKFGLSREVTEWIHTGKVDCGVVINPFPHSQLVIQQLEQDKVTLWSLKKNFKDDTLFYDPQIHQTHSLLRQLEKKGMQFKHQIEIPNLELIAKFVYEGAGIGILPEKVVKNHYPDKTQIFTNQIKPFQDNICFVYSIENKGVESIGHLKNLLKKVLC